MMSDNTLLEEDEQEEIPMKELVDFSEDEHGYVNINRKKISKVALSQLPSRNIDDLIGAEESVPEESAKETSPTLRYRNSVYNTLRFRSATRTFRVLNPSADNVYELLIDDPNKTKIQQLRDMRQSLTLKRMVKSKLDSEEKRKKDAEIVDAVTRYRFTMTMGWFADTIFFFGHYTNETIINGMEYQMTLAYIFTLGVNAVIGLIAVLYSLTAIYDTSYIESFSAMQKAFSHKVFCAWDYTIETYEASRIRKQCIYKELEEMISKEHKIDMKDTAFSTIFKYSLMLVLNTFIISIISAIGYLIYYILVQRTLEIHGQALHFLFLPLTVTAVSMTFFYIIRFITKIEFYFSKKTLFYLTMTRVVLLRATMVGVVVYYWLAVYAPNVGRNACYETRLGSEFYRLMLVNFLFAEILETLIAEFLRKFLYLYFIPFIGKPQFDIAYNILNLIYYQALVWMGAFVCPMLPLLAMMINITHFYLKINSITYNCKPSRNAWTATQTKALFLVLALAVFLITGFVVYYNIFVLPPSTCGPLMNYESSLAAFDKTVKHIEDKYGFLIQIGRYLASPGVGFAFIIGLCVILYYKAANAGAYKMIVNRLQNQLVLIGKDKVYLLEMYDNALKEKAKKMKQPGTSADGVNHPPRHVVDNRLYDHDYQFHSPPSPAVLKQCDPGYMAADVPINRRPLKKGSSSSNSPSVEPPLARPAHRVAFQYLVDGEQPPLSRTRRESSPMTDK